MTKPKLLLNRWKSNDGTVLISRFQHDFVSHFDTVDQTTVFIDGGLGPCVRVSGDLENMCLYDTDEDHMELRELYSWTSYGIDGRQPPKTQVIKDLTTDHVCAIIKTQTHLPDHVLNMFRRELTYRALLS